MQKASVWLCKPAASTQSKNQRPPPQFVADTDIPLQLRHLGKYMGWQQQLKVPKYASMRHCRAKPRGLVGLVPYVQCFIALLPGKNVQHAFVGNQRGAAAG